jgi:catechol 2,3-dioxygenase-like lactoylglutathione lyase family enzyme
MYSEELVPAEIVTLRVEDLRRSRRFYQDLLGLVATEPADQGAGVRLEHAVAGSLEAPLLLVPRVSGEGGEASWLSVQVDAVGDVLDLYLLATMLGARASLPRRRGERWNTVVQDPDGNRLSIWTAVPPETAAGPGREDQGEEREGFSRTAAERSPRWVWEESERGRAPIRHAREREDEREDRTREMRPGAGREEDAAALSWAGRMEERGPR